MKKLAIAVTILVCAVYLLNASWLAGEPADPAVGLIAHRGMHQIFDRSGLENDTCTAERIDPPQHEFLENTIPSMRAAFAAGADIVELDVHPTTDGAMAVMHDWTVDCRTEGEGATRSHDLAYLKSLDVGYGYTADGGKTFPFRGTGVGLMPSLPEVLDAMPDGRFIVNFKSREAREGDMLAALVEEEPRWKASVWGVYGSEEPVLRAKERLPGLSVWTRQGLVGCLGRYIAYGWTGIVPDQCRDTMIMVPINVAPWLWGWPNRFQQRMSSAGSGIILLGPYASGDPGTAGIDDIETLRRVPAGFSGYIWTNRIEVIGPALEGHSTKEPVSSDGI